MKPLILVGIAALIISMVLTEHTSEQEAEAK